MFSKNTYSISLLVVATLLGGCATHPLAGLTLNGSDLTKLEAHKSVKSDVLQLYGSPSSQNSNTGKIEYTYVFSCEQKQVGVQSSKEVAHILKIQFNDHDVVESFQIKQVANAIH